MRKALSKSVLVMAAASGILTAAGGYAFADASADGATAGSPGVGSGNAVQVPVHVPVNVCGNTVDVIGLLNPAFGNKCANGSGGSGNGGNGAIAQGTATDSPGVLSGNVVQAPVDVPVNACGNSVDVVGLLNPASGNECANGSGGSGNGAIAQGTASNSPGVLSGNLVQAPVHVPVNACGNSVDVVGLLNPASGNECANGSGPDTEPPVVTPPVEPPVVTPPVVTPPVTPPVVTPPVVTPPVVTPPETPRVVTPHTDESRTGNVPSVTSGVPVSTAQLAHTGADANLGLAGAASAAMVLGGTLLYRRTRASRK
ncbi:chaplin [Streptomyces sp. NPDC057543]|uniref:chaplin n=1 Tax=Streptomyces sp. NPDC057543 TaxID=3346163 RepID=UPI00367992FE